MTAPRGPTTATVITVEEYQQLKHQAQQAQEHWDRLLRLQADFDNARKRMAKERQETDQRTTDRVLGDLLGIVDDFERALAAAATDPDPAHMKQGIDMIHRRLLEFLRGHGVEPMVTVGQPFDPSHHEAVERLPRDDQPESLVLEELQKGYTRHGRVIRPAAVRVSVKPEE